MRLGGGSALRTLTRNPSKHYWVERVPTSSLKPPFTHKPTCFYFTIYSYQPTYSLSFHSLTLLSRWIDGVLPALNNHLLSVIGGHGLGYEPLYPVYKLTHLQTYTPVLPILS